jgi:hypothetical protein
VWDVSYCEGRHRSRRGNTAKHFAILRRMALSLLKQDRATEVGIQTKWLKAAWDNHYLLSLLRQ